VRELELTSTPSKARFDLLLSLVLREELALREVRPRRDLIAFVERLAEKG